MNPRASRTTKRHRLVAIAGLALGLVLPACGSGSEAALDEQRAAESATLQADIEALVRHPERTRAVARPGGGRAAYLQGGHVVVVRRAADGTISRSCVDHPDQVEGALTGGAPAVARSLAEMR